MELIKSKWGDLKSVCESLYDNNPYLSPYQEYSFLDIIKKSTNIHNLKEWMAGKNVTYLSKINGKIIGVLPLVVNRKRKEINLIGYLCSVGHLDFIYKRDLSYEEFVELLNQLRELYKGYTLHLDRISQFSLTYKYLTSMGVESKASSTCVKIDFDTYDNWFSSLSKSCKQNVRTAYNRIIRENKELDIRIAIAEEPTEKMVADNINLLSKRTIEHNKKPSFLFPLMKLLKGNEALTKALLTSKRFIGANIYLDGNVIAICNGLIANDGRAIITRLSIDTSFGVYCPGGLIINELIKSVINSGQPINSIDLSRGDEKYKYTYGGHDHYNYEFFINL
jgi:hypothetical protein